MGPSSADFATAQTFFDRFARTFTTFDGNQVADLFATPCVALRRDGSIVPLMTREDVVRYYQAALDSYRRDGCRTARWSRLETTSMGRRSLLVTASWELLREDGTVEIQWRESYSLRNFDDDDPRAFASVMHAD